MLVKVKPELIASLESRLGQLCVESGKVFRGLGGTLKPNGLYECKLSCVDAVGGEEKFSLESLLAGKGGGVADVAPEPVAEPENPPEAAE